MISASERAASFSHLVDGIGRSSFAADLLETVGKYARAEHCVVYRYQKDDVNVIAVASAGGAQTAMRNSARYRSSLVFKRDVELRELKQSLSGYQASVSCSRADEVPDPEFRHDFFLSQRVAARALLIGERNGELFGISLLRNQESGIFQEEESRAIRATADVLVSFVAKHDDFLRREVAVNSAFSSVPVLERILGSLPHALTERERQVCARIVAGLTIKEIARDLKISPDSAVTYRRRAYLRLGVANRVGLLPYILGAG